MRTLHNIIVHCSATKAGWRAGAPIQEIVAEFNRWHLALGWKGIGYHFVIGRGGEVAMGRAISKVGAHVRGHNAGTVGVCLVGGGEADARKDDPFSKHFTPAQDIALRKLINDLKAEHPHITKVSGHNDYTDKKTCPTFQVSEWMAEAPATSARVNLLVAFFEALARLFGGKS
jgi:N-acetylmuramoyl-L-alanine amidase